MLRTRSVLLLAALAAGCGGATPPAGPAPAAWTEASPADSIAEWVVRGCRRGAGTDRQCAERALYSVIEPAGVGKAMAALDRVLARAPGLASDAHGFAHGMGIAAYRTPETVGRTFASCPPTQMSGCYHGVIQGYFLALKRDSGAVSPAVLNAVCEEHRGQPSLFFQCAHGLGHGVMALESHHLPRALARCDELSDRFVRENCYGGAFMENIVAVSHPHHTAEAHSALAGDGEHAAHGASAGGHAGHGPAAADSAAGAHAGHAAPTEHAAHSPAEHAQHLAGPWQALREDDLLYPCTVVGDQYQNQCYQMQSSAALFLTRGSVTAVAAACARAPAAHVQACYASLGRDISAIARLVPARSVELCRGAGDAAVVPCIAGVARSFVNLQGKPADGLAFCRAVPAGPAKRECYRVVGNMALSTTPAPADREAACAAAEPEHVAACRAGAALPETR